MKFNGITSQESDQPVGVPQGSPLSPVLSVTYTSSLLHKMKHWNQSSLGMYVDDGLLFACAEEWSDISRLLTVRYSVCDEWLRRSGLAIEPEKTELLFFQKPKERNPVPAPTRLLLPNRDISSYFVVQPVETLRYLGFFINRRLKWEPHVRIMCNRARASIKALMVLGNTIRGLSMANWRLVMNTVCLSVLTYGCQLWYRDKGSKTLIGMVQRVQNEMVKVVAGAFHMASREPLLHITCMLPMRHHLEKLTHTSALRLYRLPWASQLLRRLGPDWFSPGQGDFPLVVTNPPSMPELRPTCQTALEALAARVPSDGPRVNVTAIAPWEVPNWGASLTYMGPGDAHGRKTWTMELCSSSQGLSNLIIHTAAKVTFQGRADGKIVGGAASTWSVSGGPHNRTAWTMGTDLMQFDAEVFGLARTAEVMAYLFSEVPPPQNIYIFSNSSSALQAIRNPRAKPSHDYSLCFYHALTYITTKFPLTKYFLVWTPVDATLEGQWMARVGAHQACLTDPPDGFNRINSAAFQKDRTRTLAYQRWTVDFYWEQLKHHFLSQWNGVGSLGEAYKHALINPPDGSNHPLWVAATSMEKDEFGRPTKTPKYSRRTTSTLLQLTVDHAFTGSYARRFRKADPIETTHCPCGFHIQTPEHLIHTCPRFTAHRINSGIYSAYFTTPYPRLFQIPKDIHKLLEFLQTSRAASAPEVVLPPPVASQTRIGKRPKGHRSIYMEHYLTSMRLTHTFNLYLRLH
jgi:Reverse transcriptase (RNA-dependent DNA polymerase)